MVILTRGSGGPVAHGNFNERIWGLGVTHATPGPWSCTVLEYSRVQFWSTVLYCSGVQSCSTSVLQSFFLWAHCKLSSRAEGQIVFCTLSEFLKAACC